MGVPRHGGIGLVCHMEETVKLLRTLSQAIVLATAVIVTSTAAASASSLCSFRPTDYYLSLGDSLSVGFQPGADGVGRPTDHGYDHDLLPALRAAELRQGRDLRLTELGCPAETTTSMINGGVCTYAGASSQLDAATAFLAAHRGHVSLVTLAIGATDVEDCATTTGIDLACVQQGVATVGANLTTIVTRLRQADPGARTRFVGLNEYDPFLALYLQGAAGQQIAAESVELVGVLNQTLAADYQPAGFQVADVATAFRTTQTSPMVPLPGFGEVPQNVASICQLTYMCAPAPVGPNIHPTDAGYATMARSIAAKL